MLCPKCYDYLIDCKWNIVSVDGNGTKIWQPSIVEGTPDMLLGHPVDYDDNLSGEAAGEIPAMFGDFSYYNIGDRGDIYIQVLREKYADKGAIGILVDKRTDGKGIGSLMRLS